MLGAARLGIEARSAQLPFDVATGFFQALGGGFQPQFEARAAQGYGVVHQAAKGRVVDVEVNFVVRPPPAAGRAPAHRRGGLVHLVRRLVQLTAHFSVRFAGLLVHFPRLLVQFAGLPVQFAGLLVEAAIPAPAPAVGGGGQGHHRHLPAGAPLGFRGLGGGGFHRLPVHGQAGQASFFVFRDDHRTGSVSRTRPFLADRYFLAYPGLVVGRGRRRRRGGHGLRHGGRRGGYRRHHGGALGALAGVGWAGRARRGAGLPVKRGHLAQRRAGQRPGQRHAAAQQAQPA